LFLELIRPPKKDKAPKAPADKAEASKVFKAAGTTASDGMAALEPPAPQAVVDNKAPPLGREETPEVVVHEVQLDQDRIKVPEDEDGEITE
jgi:hypothetical protein